MTITQHTIPSWDPRLKRHIRWDSRSLAYPFQTPPGTELNSVRWPRSAPVFDQGQIGDCTANAAEGVLATAPFDATLAGLTQPPGYTQDGPNGCVEIYHEETLADHYNGTYPPDDTGSDGLTAATVCKARGWISGFTHVLSGAAGLAAALQYGSAMIGISWFDSFYTPSSDGEISIAPGANVVGGHELCVDEYRLDNGGMFGITNSWGESWGPIGGRCYISASLMNRLLSSAMGGDATVFTPLNQPAPVPITDPALARLVAKTSHWVASQFPAFGAVSAQHELRRYLAAEN